MEAQRYNYLKMEYICQKLPLWSSLDLHNTMAAIPPMSLWVNALTFLRPAYPWVEAEYARIPGLSKY